MVLRASGVRSRGNIPRPVLTDMLPVRIIKAAEYYRVFVVRTTTNGRQLARRKELSLILGERDVGGGDRKSPGQFDRVIPTTADIAKDHGMSERTLRRHERIGEGIQAPAL